MLHACIFAVTLKHIHCNNFTTKVYQTYHIGQDYDENNDYRRKQRRQRCLTETSCLHDIVSLRTPDSAFHWNSLSSRSKPISEFLSTRLARSFVCLLHVLKCNSNKKLLITTENVLFHSNKTHINITFLLYWKIHVSSRTQGVIVINIHLSNYKRLVIFSIFIGAPQLCLNVLQR